MTFFKKITETRLAQFLICAGVVFFFMPLSLFATWQFTTSGLQTDVTGGVTEWCGNGGAVLTPYHTETNGWTYSERVGKGVVFDSQSSPLAFSSAVTAEVSRVFVVASLARLSPHSTLVDAPSGVRIDVDPIPGEDWAYSENTYSNQVNFAVDGAVVTNAALGTHLYEVVFDTPLCASDIYIGNHPALALWKRGWQGSIYEIIVITESVTERELQAVRSYLARKWRLVRHQSIGEDEREVLRSMGIKTALAYATLMKLR